MEDYIQSTGLIKHNYSDLRHVMDETSFTYSIDVYQQKLLNVLKQSHKNAYFIILEKDYVMYPILINISILCLNMLCIKDDISDHNEIINSNQELFKMKNNDYGCSYEDFGLLGIIVRLNDKINRIKVIINKKTEQKVKDENIKETINDLYNYCVIGLSYKFKNIDNL